MSKLQAYAVLSHLTMDDRTYEPGSTVEMDPEVAAPLVDDGVLGDPDAVEAVPEAGGVDPELAEIAGQLPLDQLRAFAALSPEERAAALEPGANGPGALAEAMPRLQEKDLSKDGKPRTSALRRVTGRDWSAEDRDEAWEGLPAIAAALRHLVPPEREPADDQG